MGNFLFFERMFEHKSEIVTVRGNSFYVKYLDVLHDLTSLDYGIWIDTPNLFKYDSIGADDGRTIIQTRNIEFINKDVEKNLYDIAYRYEYIDTDAGFLKRLFGLDKKTVVGKVVEDGILLRTKITEYSDYEIKTHIELYYAKE